MNKSIHVVKIGGSTLGTHDTTMQDIAALVKAGESIVVVHGGGKTITEWLAKIGVPTQFVRGLRVTDAASLEVVVAVLAGVVNKQLVSELLTQDVAATGLSGADGRTLVVQQVSEDLGFVGEVTAVNPQAIEALLDAALTPVVAPVGVDATGGQLFNVNADTAARAIAAALRATSLVFLTDVPGVKDASGSVVRTLTPDQTNALIRSGVIAGGMIPKVEACLAAGCRAAILDGREPGALQAAVMGQGGSGTWFEPVTG